MKDLEDQSSWGAAEPSPELLKELEVRPVLPGEMERVRRLLDDEHYLGAGRAVGRTLVQVVHHRGRWAALLVWGPAAVKLLDRDERVGWTHQQRAERLGLLVQNRRFLVLAGARMPNLASRSLALAVRELPVQWEAAWGYRPLLAETFTDIEAFEGTCYKAAGWEPCGLTKGFGRHRGDFYRQHDRPKKLWLKALGREAEALLRAPELPEACRAGTDPQSAERSLPLRRGQIDSLREALREVPDPRASNRSWPISTLLSLVCVALLAGRRNLAEIHRFGQLLTQAQRAWLGFLPKSGGVAGRRAPSYKALYNLLCQLPAETLAEALNRWLERSRDGLPRALALDGKYVRDLVLTLGLSEHGSGAPAAMLVASREAKSEEAKAEGEITAAKRFYRSGKLSGTTVTGDALHCERESMQLVVEAGGDFLFQLKANQPNALKRAEALAAVQPPFFAATPPTPATGGSKSGR